MTRIKAVVWDVLGICFYDARRDVIKNISEATKIPYGLVREVLFDNLGPLLRKGRLTFDDFKDTAKDAGVDLSKVDIKKAWFAPYRKRAGIEDLIDEVKQKGRTNISLSNNFPELVTYLDDVAGFDFKERFSQSLWSYEVGFTKPSREMYDKLIEVTGLQGYEMLFVDDQQKNFPEYLIDKLKVKKLHVPNDTCDLVVIGAIREGLREYGIQVRKR